LRWRNESQTVYRLLFLSGDNVTLKVAIYYTPHQIQRQTARKEFQTIPQGSLLNNKVWEFKIKDALEKEQ
jgi:hypothetical protein